MSAFDQRRLEDLQKLRQLAAQAPSRLKVGRVKGNPAEEIELDLLFKTAPSQHYPNAVQQRTLLVLSLPARYPLAAPTASIKTPILHPNVYSGGTICLGMKWLPASGLDLLVKRIIQIITFDPTVLNEDSPANRDALEWYRRAKRQHPGAFPTDTALLPAEQPKKVIWSNIPTEPPVKTVVSCPGCGSKLSVPTGKTGTAKCPHCSTTFAVRT
jgi:ubiquitin-protein ligase